MKKFLKRAKWVAAPLVLMFLLATPAPALACDGGPGSSPTPEMLMAEMEAWGAFILFFEIGMIIGYYASVWYHTPSGPPGAQYLVSCHG